jgi:hypothetical protein
MELNLERFSPAKAELHALVEKAQLVTKDSSPAEVHEMRSLLRSTRTGITKTGKAMREDAIKFQKDVIAKEKELVGIIESEEERIAAIEDDMERARLREERKAVLPQRKERLEAIGDGIFETDDHILDMDGPEFEGYCNLRMANKNEGDRLTLEAEKRKVEEELLKLQREKEAQEREERARQFERERVEREERDRQVREQEDKESAERKAKMEREALEREERYQEFPSRHGVTIDSLKNSTEYIVIRTASEIMLYKQVDTFKIK